MSSGDRSTAGASATDDALTRVLTLATARLERAGLEPAGRLRLPAITDAEVRALSGLLGGRWRAVLPGTAASVDLAALDSAIRASPRWPGGLADACAAVRGAALVDRRAARLDAVAERRRGWDGLREHPAVRRHPALAGWLDRERATGSAVRTGAGDPFPLLTDALDVVGVVPADPPQTLARFAASHCGGDPHALDRSRPLDPTVRRALAHLDGDDAPAAGAEARRIRYDRWGIGCDELSSTVLTLGVWPGADEPRVLTLRELRGLDRLPCGPDVFTCENPDVVAAAADALGSTCPPLVCTGGWPSTAAVRILRATIAGGARAHHHGDMDPEGLRILDRLITTTGGLLWRMDAENHDRHAAAGALLTDRYTGAGLVHGGLALLARALTENRRVVQEEQAIPDLMADLGAAARSAGTAW